MGCDGGTIPKRCELVPEKKKKEKKDKNMERIAKWSTCALSNRKLAIPIASCRRGRFYNKDAVIEHILNNSQKGGFSYIKKLKHVKELSLKPNPSFKDSYMTDVELKTTSQFLCPVTNLEMNGKHEFIFIWNCGCVMSKRAMNTIKENQCIVCGTSFNPDDIITLNPNEDILNESGSIKSESINKNFKGVSKAKGDQLTSTDQSKTPKTPKIFNEKTMIDPSLIKKQSDIAHDKTSIKTDVYKSLFTSSDSYQTKSKNSKPYCVSTFNYSV